MAEYIEREALIERLKRNLNACNPGTFSELCFRDAINTVTNFPAADVAPVVHGRWDSIFNGDFEVSYCTNCMKVQGLYINGRKPNWPYCPSCGAKMDAEA